MRRRGGCSWQHDNAELSSPCGRSELRVRGGLRRRVPGLPLRVQRRRLRRTRHSGSRQARPGRRQRAGRGRDRRPRRARRAGLDRRAAQRARALPRPSLGARLARRRRGARVLAEEARLPRRMARPPGQGRPPRARTRPLVARVAVPPLARTAAIAAYLAALLWVDRSVDLHGQLALGALTWIVLVLAARPLPPERRAQVAVVICAATVAEVTGSILWGVYSYRLHNLPTFVPPAHGLVFIAGLSLSDALRRHARVLVSVAATSAAGWGLLGLTVLPRMDAAGALGVPLLLAFLWRSRARTAYAGVFLVVAVLELYGTAIGTWRWAAELPGLGIPDGNPPSGAASGYVWFDVMALLFGPRLLGLIERYRPFRTRPVPGAGRAPSGQPPTTDTAT